MVSDVLHQVLFSILKSKKAVDAFLAANPGKTQEQLLSSAIDVKNARTLVRRKTRESAKEVEKVDLAKRARFGNWEEVLFIARAVVLCGLPYRRTKNRELVKTARLGNGDRITVTFKASKEGVDLPFGKDRALLAWITTCAKKQGGRRVQFDTTAEFIRAFGLADSGTHYKAFRESLDRLKGFSCYIEVADGSKEGSLHESVIKKAVIPTRKDARKELAGEVRLLSESSGGDYYLELDESFYQELVEHSVPLPLDLMRRYGNNPVAWDFIQFVSYRSAAAKTTSRIPLEPFFAMLGSVDSNPWRLRSSLETVLKELREIWPEVNARFEGKASKTVFLIGPPENNHTLVPRKPAKTLANGEGAGEATG